MSEIRRCAEDDAFSTLGRAPSLRGGMILRRIRATAVIAAVCGLLGCVATLGITSVMYVLTPDKVVRQNLFIDFWYSLPTFFGYGAAMGALLAGILMVAERRRTLQTIHARRFKLSGAMAGAIVNVLCFPLVIPASWSWSGVNAAVMTVVGGGYIGYALATGILWMARRGEKNNVRRITTRGERRPAERDRAVRAPSWR